MVFSFRFRHLAAPGRWLKEYHVDRRWNIRLSPILKALYCKADPTTDESGFEPEDDR
jgi:hypothetical protein